MILHHFATINVIIRSMKGFQPEGGPQQSDGKRSMGSLFTCYYSCIYCDFDSLCKSNTRQQQYQTKNTIAFEVIIL